MDLTKLFNLHYLFQRYPVAGFSWSLRIVLLILFIGAICIAIYAHWKLKKESSLIKRVWRKLEVWGWTIGLIGLLLVMFREVRALYLSSRGVLLLLIIAMFIWLIPIFITWIKSKKEQVQKDKDREVFKKWLPKKK